MERRTISCSWAIILSLALSANVVDAASFDCAKASTPQEKLICSTPSLSILDEQVGALYKIHMDKLPDAPKASFRDGQREWVKYRQAICPVIKPEPDAETPAKCMERLYQDRLKSLSEALFSSGPYSFLTIQRIRMTVGKDEEGQEAFSTSVVKVPWLLTPAGPGADRFNIELKQMVDRYIAPLIETAEFDGFIEYEGSVHIQYAGDTLISLQQFDYTYPHRALHGTTGITSVNWLFREGRALRAEDLFKPGSNWQATLAKLVHAEVKKTVETFDDFTEDPNGLHETTDSPTNWILSPDSLSVQFSEYEVGPYAIGAPTVAIPWTLLKPYLVDNPPMPLHFVAVPAPSPAVADSAPGGDTFESLRQRAEQGDAEAQYGLGKAFFLGEGMPQDTAQALKWYRMAADQGNSNAQFILGTMYLKGEAVPQNDAEAAKLFRMAADQGNAFGQLGLGHAYEKGKGVAENSAEAIKWYRMAAERGNAVAQANLGSMYNKGKGVPENSVEALKWCRMAADQGIAKAQFCIGSMYDNGKGVPQNDAEAVNWYRMAAEQGYADAQYSLGIMYDKGKGVAQDGAEAAKWYLKSADQGNPEAQFNLGLMYSNGNNGVERNDIKAFGLFLRAANQGHARAQFLVGEIHQTGDGIPQNDFKAFEWYRKAAEQGNATAQHRIGAMYDDGKGVPESHTEAIKWYRMAAEQGVADSQYRLGIMYDYGIGVPENGAEAAKWYRMVADKGNAFAQLYLGSIYDNGKGVPENKTEAAKWFRMAAEQGNADAQTILGTKYLSGEGVSENNDEAARWYRKAADQGYADAQEMLGMMYDRGEGVPENGGEAAKWFKKAADQGNAGAQVSLGLMFAHGRGVPQDYAEALKWYRKAVDQGSAEGQVNLGLMYFNGDGVPKDLAEAGKWFKLAADQGNDKAQSMLGALRMAAGLTPSSAPQPPPPPPPAAPPMAAPPKAAATFDPSFKIKGLYLGMDIKTVPAILKQKFPAGQDFEVADMISERQSVLVLHGVDGVVCIVACGPDNPAVIAIAFEKVAVDALFNAAGMEASEFAKTFIEAYQIPGMNVSDDRMSWFYLSPEGYRVNITQGKQLIIVLTPNSTQRKKSFD